MRPGTQDYQADVKGRRGDFVMSDIPVPKPIRDEYTSVADTTCACGAAAFVVEKQWLVQTPWGYSDWLEARCRACGATRGFAFPLPGFGQRRGSGR